MSRFLEKKTNSKSDKNQSSPLIVSCELNMAMPPHSTVGGCISAGFYVIRVRVRVSKHTADRHRSAACYTVLRQTEQWGKQTCNLVIYVSPHVLCTVIPSKLPGKYSNDNKTMTHQWKYFWKPHRLSSGLISCLHSVFDCHCRRPKLTKESFCYAMRVYNRALFFTSSDSNSSNNNHPLNLGWSRWLHVT